MTPMTHIPAGTTPAPHGLHRITARDRAEAHRAATPLELLYDLVFVAAFSQAGVALAHQVETGNVAGGVLAFSVAMFAVVWAWVGNTWFSSAFDTDDWLQRLSTMVQMAGVVILALGIPPFFESLHHERVHNGPMVAGYIVMRLGLLAQWVRVYLRVPEHRHRAGVVILWTVVAQIGWTLTAVFPTTWPVFVGAGLVLTGFELLGHLLPSGSQQAPWHPHHLAERFGLIAIITLGESIVGTIAALQTALPEQGGWTLQPVLVVAAGLGLTFGVWWSYFGVDFGRALAARPSVAGIFTVLHLVILGSIAAMGAGLHVAGAALAHPEEASPELAVLFVGVPLLVFYLGFYGLYTVFVPEADLRHIVLILLTLVLAATGPLLAWWGVPMGWCLLVVAAATLPTVVGYEWFGHDHQEQQLRRLERRPR